MRLGKIKILSQTLKNEAEIPKIYSGNFVFNQKIRSFKRQKILMKWLVESRMRLCRETKKVNYPYIEKMPKIL